jgi:hypothetical protein
MRGHHQHTKSTQTVAQNREVTEKEISPKANFIKNACRNFKMYGPCRTWFRNLCQFTILPLHTGAVLITTSLFAQINLISAASFMWAVTLQFLRSNKTLHQNRTQWLQDFLAGARKPKFRNWISFLSINPFHATHNYFACEEWPL